MKTLTKQIKIHSFKFWILYKQLQKDWGKLVGVFYGKIAAIFSRMFATYWTFFYLKQACGNLSLQAWLFCTVSLPQALVLSGCSFLGQSQWCRSSETGTLLWELTRVDPYTFRDHSRVYTKRAFKANYWRRAIFGRKGYYRSNRFEKFSQFNDVFFDGGWHVKHLHVSITCINSIIWFFIRILNFIV